MIDHKKEFINMIRNKSNHALVIIVTIGAGTTKFLIESNFNLWFFISLFVTIIATVFYTYLSILEYQNINEIIELKEKMENKND